MNKNTKKCVLLVNLGSPSNQQNAGRFIFNLLYDRHILKMNPISRFIIASLITLFRKKKVQNKLIQIGGSPLLEITKKQCELLKESLGSEFSVYFAMRYSEPSIKNVIKRITEDGCNELIVIPLFPHYSTATAQSVFDEVEKTIKKIHAELIIIKIERFYNEEFFIRALSNGIIETVKSKNFNFNNLTILVSAHNMLRKRVLMGDPYRKEVEESAVLLKNELIRQDERFKTCKFRLGFQSRIMPFLWLYPIVEEILFKEAEKKREVLLVPVSFVADNLETLYDIDIYLRGYSLAMGVAKFERAPALNTNPLFIEMLKRIVIRT